MLNWIVILLASTLLFGGADSFIPWQAARPLKWEDFQAPPNPDSEMLAHTKSDLKVSWLCDNDQFNFEVIAKFDKSGSWHRANPTDALLMHEQLHFNITELYARKMRKYFKDEVKGCLLDDADITTRVNSFFNKWRAMESRYDDETDHGRDKAEQAIWAENVNKELQKYARYALP